jgi:hypothetical protein
MKDLLNYKNSTKGIILLAFLMIWTTSYPQVKSEKRGIAYGYNAAADFAAIQSGVSWWYNWNYKPENTIASVYEDYGMDFVPMTWNGSFNEAGLRAFYSSHPNARYLLGFNEPNFTTQANMKPSQAAAIWPKLEQIAEDFNLKIVSPAVNYADKPVTENGVTYSDPIDYLDAFFAACPNCQVDYIAMHNYMCYAGALSGDVERYKKYGKPIWLTEFACWDQPSITLDMQKSYMMGAIDYLESDTMVFRYSWFNGRSGGYPYLDLYKSQGGQLTDLGNLYVSFNPIHDPSAYTPIPARLEAEYYTAMSGIALEATKDISGNANVGWIDANDWLEYNIEVAATADYNVFFRISANATTSLELRENNDRLQTLQIPGSGGWQNWKTLKTSVNLTEGKHVLQVFTPKGQFNLNWLEITTETQPTAVSELAQNKVKVYPNPVTDELTVETNHPSGETKISVLDYSGREIYSETMSGLNGQKTVDFNNLKSGIYIVKVRNSDSTSSHLIIK